MASPRVHCWPSCITPWICRKAGVPGCRMHAGPTCNVLEAWHATATCVLSGDATTLTG